jgi:hypothetical protein
MNGLILLFPNRLPGHRAPELAGGRHPNPTKYTLLLYAHRTRLSEFRQLILESRVSIHAPNVSRAQCARSRLAPQFNNFPSTLHPVSVISSRPLSPRPPIGIDHATPQNNG